MRLIDADKLNKPLQKVLSKAMHSTVGWTLGRMFEECREVIDKADTIKVNPLRIGEWEDYDGMFRVRCSYCGSVYKDENIENIKKYQYCPNCGTWMKRKEKDK